MAIVPSDFLLQFGPRVPEGAVNLAYLGIPALEADENAAVIATGRWSPANQTGDLSVPIADPDASLVYPEPFGAAAITTALPLDSQAARGRGLRLATQPIRVLPPVEDAAGSWHLAVQDGTIARIVTLDSREADFSWLRVPTASGGPGYQDGDVLLLLYTLPESAFAPYGVPAGHGIPDADAPGYRLVTVTDERATVLDAHRLALANGDLAAVFAVRTLGIPDTTGAATTTDLTAELVIADDQAGILRSVPAGGDPSQTGRAFTPDDAVLVTYAYYAQEYVYPGYCDDQGTYHALDLCPQAGHAFDRADAPTATRALLNTPVYVYLLPSAAMKIGAAAADGTITYTASSGTGSSGVYTLTSCLPWKPFPLRWMTAQNGNPNGEYYLPDRASHFGLARLDLDSFSARLSAPPLAMGGGINGLALSALLLAEVYVGPNATVDSVVILDTRTRGGGVAETDAAYKRDYTAVAQGRLDEIAGYWDVGNWDGPPAMLDGVVIVEIPKGVRDGSDGYPQINEVTIREAVEQWLAAGVYYELAYI